MGLATVEQVRAMDYCFNGQPFVDTPLNITVDIGSMNYAFEGRPFAANRQTTAVTTVVEMTPETISIADSLNAFNTVCPMSEIVAVTDALSNVLLVYGMAENITVTDGYDRYNALCTMAEDTVLADFISAFNTVFTFPTEDINITDAFVPNALYPRTVEDGMDMTDDYLLSWVKVLSEYLAINDISSAGVIKLVEILETLLVYDSTKIGWALTAESSLVLADTIQTILGILVDDWLTLTDSETSNWNGREIATDSITLYDIASGGKRYADTIDESIVVTDSSLYKLTITVLESLGFTDLANALRSASESVSDSVALTDSPAHALSFLIAETLDVVDAASIMAAFIHSIDESLGLADAASLIGRLGVTVADPLVFTETVSSKANLYNLVYDTLALNVTVELNGEVYECYVLNTPKFHPSMYSGFDFNSYCVFENRAFGANSVGVYELTGDTDSGATIHTGAILNETDFGAPNQKRFRHGYLGISGTNPVMVFETEDGTRQAYNIDTKGKLVASSELKSKKWTLSVAEYESLDTIQLIPIILTK